MINPDPDDDPILNHNPPPLAMHPEMQQMLQSILHNNSLSYNQKTVLGGLVYQLHLELVALQNVSTNPHMPQQSLAEYVHEEEPIVRGMIATVRYHSSNQTLINYCEQMQALILQWIIAYLL